MRIVIAVITVLYVTSVPVNIKAQSFIVGDTVCPSGTYVNIADTILPLKVKYWSELNMDIDFDGMADIRFRRSHNSSPSFNEETFTVYSLNTIQFVCLPNTNYADTLSPGTILDESLNWNTDYSSASLYYYFHSYVPPPWGPGDAEYGVCNRPNIYIGFRKILDEYTLYGWIFFDSYAPFRIKSYAINKKLSAGIIDHTSKSGKIIIKTNPSERYLEISGPATRIGDYQLIIKTVNGNEVFKKDISFNGKFTIDMQNYNDGLYIVVLQNKKQQFVNKFLLHRK